ncbi:MAG: SDR family oxidoreductase [Alphaproteobacteria bacterium]|nr:SDR family oxidoreductase [Alphaproteobacteria bacterium]
MTHPSTCLFDLSERTAIVTGGGGILGRYFCHALAAYGANVVVVDRNQDAAQQVAASLPGKPLAIGMDITDEQAVIHLKDRVCSTYGGIDILHNNAATKPADLARFFDSVETFQDDVWQEVMRVNVDGMFLVAKHIGGEMARRGRGSIIQTASIYGILAPDQRIYEGSDYLGHHINTPAVYSASKAAVVGLTRHLATYWAGRGVRVNTLTPGGVESGQNQTFKDRYSARVPLGRMAQPQEMTGALVFLASDASSYITGQNIIVDGGLSAW